MNTSMTINATAMWLLALYQVAAEEQGAPVAELAGTTQNDIIKEYLSRGTYVFPPGPSLRLITDMVAYTVREMPRWNPINVCSYHLQEAGATPVQEIAYALSTAIAVLDAVRDSGQVDPADFGEVVGRISFFVNAGVRFVEEMCKMRAFAQLWDELTSTRYGVTDPKLRRFRYGVQVNSLGLTEAQPENNVQRIVLEMLGVTLSRDARARAVQLPAWNEALGLPRPWDQQWSLRLQQVLAYESDLLEYEDLFTGSVVVEAKVAELVEGARAEMARVADLGGAVAAVESGYMKSALVASHAARRGRIESGDEVVVGRQPVHHHRTEPAHGRPGLGDPGRRRRRGGGCGGGRSPLAGGARRGPGPSHTGGACPRAAAGRGCGRDQPRPRDPGVRPRRSDDGGVGRSAAGGVRRVPRPDGGLVDGGSGRGSGRPRGGEERGGADQRRGRPPAAGAGRQAGPRRAQQRRRADRGPGARRGVRGGLPGDPADSGARSSRPRWPRTCTWSGCRSCPGRTSRWFPTCWTVCVRRARATCRSSSAGSSRRPTRRSLLDLGVAAVFTPKDFAITDIMGEFVRLIRAAHGLDPRRPSERPLLAVSPAGDG